MAEMSPVKESRASVLSYPGVLVWALPLIVFLVLAMGRIGDDPDLQSGDYAHYLLLAQALSEGRSYTDTGYIYSPLSPWTGPAVYPPGLPLLLALQSTVVGFEPLANRALVLAFGCAFLLLVGRYFARERDGPTACGVMLLLAVSPDIVGGSTSVLSDIPFSACAWGLVLLYDAPNRWRKRQIVLATALLVCALLLRTAAAALLPAVAVYWLLNRARCGVGPLLPLLIVSAGGLTAAVAVLVASSLSPDETARMIAFPLDSVGIHLGRLWGYRLAFLQALLYPLPWNLANDVYHLLSGGLVMLGLAAWLLNAYRKFLPIFAVAYVVMLLTAGPQTGRYLWVLAPVIAFGLLNGVGLTWQWVRERVPAAQGLASSHAVVGVAGLLAILTVTAGPEETASPGLTERPEAQQLFAFFDPALHDSRPRVVFVKPRVLAWETGVAAMASFRGPPPVLLREWQRRAITHVVIGSYELDSVADEALAATVRAHPDRLEPVFSNAEFSVYRIVEGAQP